MDIVYAAEKPSIAMLLSEYTKSQVNPSDIRVFENPDETGSFCIGFQLQRYVMSPDGRIEADLQSKHNIRQLSGFTKQHRKSIRVAAD